MRTQRLCWAGTLALSIPIVLLLSAQRFTSAPYPEFTLVTQKSVVAANGSARVYLERVAQAGNGAEAHDIIPLDSYTAGSGSYVVFRSDRWVIAKQSFRRRWKRDCSDAFGDYKSLTAAQDVFGFKTIAFQFDNRNPGDTAHTKSTLLAAPALGCAVVGDSNEEYDSAGNLVRITHGEARALYAGNALTAAPPR